MSIVEKLSIRERRKLKPRKSYKDKRTNRLRSILKRVDGPISIEYFSGRLKRTPLTEFVDAIRACLGMLPICKITFEAMRKPTCNTTRA